MSKDNDKKPTIEYAGPKMVDGAPSILSSEKKSEHKPQAESQPQTQHQAKPHPQTGGKKGARRRKNGQYTQTPPPNYQAPPNSQNRQGPPPNYESGQTPPPNYQAPPQYATPPYYGYPKKGNGWRNGLIVFAIIVAILVFLAYISNSFFGKMFEAEPSYEVPNDKYIARISIEGEITAASSDGYLASDTGYDHQFTLDSLDEITEDENNVALLLFVDTPGGGVYESDQIYNKIKTYKEKTGRPVYVAMGSMAASGGYYVSAPADKIYADRNTWTGSIGVTMGTFYDISKLLKKYGIKAENLTSGRNKAMGSMVEPLTAEQRAIFQSLLDDAYYQFVGIIAEGRQMDQATVVKLADGRIYTANQAKANGLIDDIATEEQVTALLKQDFGLGDCEVVPFESYNSSWIDDFFYSNMMPALDRLKSLGKGDLEKALELVENSQNSPLQYLYGN